jgi:hypothetical protein
MGFFPSKNYSQALGGLSTFNFLSYPTDPSVAALGGVHLTQDTRNANPGFYNPSLIRPSHHHQLNAVVHDNYAGTGIYNLSFVQDFPSWKTTAGAAIHFFDYGKTVETDPSGNELGVFRPHEWYVQVSVARAYESRWHYGASLKYMMSSFGQFRSSGIAMDMGIHYRDTTHRLSISVLAKNMGQQLSSFPGAGQEDLPFDFQAGITHRLANAPFSFSLSAQKLHRFDIVYDDTAYNNANGFNPRERGSGIEKLWRHFVLGVTVHLGERVNLHAGYNVLRRKELSVGSAGNGLNGFGMGMDVFLGKWQVRYARSYYQPQSAINQFGIGMELDELF